MRGFPGAVPGAPSGCRRPFRATQRVWCRRWSPSAHHAQLPVCHLPGSHISLKSARARRLFGDRPPRLPFQRVKQTAWAVSLQGSPAPTEGVFSELPSLLCAEVHISSADPFHPGHTDPPGLGSLPICSIAASCGRDSAGKFSGSDRLHAHGRESPSDAGALFPSPCFNLCPLHRPISTWQPQ